MPRSKRARVVHLSKVQKKTKDSKDALVEKIHTAIEKYPFIYVFEIDNSRNSILQDFRALIAHDSKIVMGRNGVMANALGKSPEKAQAPGLDELAPHLKGQSGLLFSARGPDEMVPFLETVTTSAFGRAGNAANRDFVIPAGTVYATGGQVEATEDVGVTVGQEVTLRAFGMPTRTAGGRVILEQPYTVCRKDDVLTSSQSSILKFFGVQTAEFKVNVKAVVKNAGATGLSDDEDDENEA